MGWIKEVKVSRRLWIMLLLVVLVNQFNLYATLSHTLDLIPTGAAVGQTSLTIGNAASFNYTCPTNITDANGRWNYVSVPVSLVDSSVGTALSSVDGNYDWVFEYDHSAGSFDYYLASFATGTISEIENGDCYIIKATDEASIVWEGNDYYTNTSQNLTDDFGRWNYVGWVNSSDSVSDAFSSVDGSYDWVFRYDALEGVFDYYLASFASGTLSSVDPCECYIVKATDNVTLSYS